MSVMTSERYGYPPEFRSIALGMLCTHLSPSPDAIWGEMHILRNPVKDGSGSQRVIDVALGLVTIDHTLSQLLNRLEATDLDQSRAVFKDVAQELRSGFELAYSENNAMEKACLGQDVDPNVIVLAVEEANETILSEKHLFNIESLLEECSNLEAGINRELDAQAMQQVGAMADRDAVAAAREKIEEANAQAEDVVPINYQSFSEGKKAYMAWTEKSRLIAVTERVKQGFSR